MNNLFLSGMCSAGTVIITIAFQLARTINHRRRVHVTVTIGKSMIVSHVNPEANYRLMSIVAD